MKSAQKPSLTQGVLSLLAIVLLAGPAHAHAPIQGMDAFYSGLLHPFRAPAQLLVLVGLGLWLAQHALTNMRVALTTFVSTTTLALIVAFAGSAPEIPRGLFLLLAAGIGGLLVAEQNLPRLASGLLFGLIGILIGLDSAVEETARGLLLQSLFGSWLCVNVLTFDIAWYLSRLNRGPVVRIGLRVLGSWIAACALMILALSLKR